MGKKLKHGFWWRGGFIHTRDPVTGERTSTRCRDQAAAELWRAERERLAANPAYAASLQATVGGWAVKTMAHKESRRAAGTLVMYRIKLGHVVRLFGSGAPLATITPGAVDEYITTRSKEGAANNTIHKELTCLWQMLKLAKRAREFAGDLDELKPSDFSAGYVPRTRVLLRADLPRLMAALPSDVERAWVAFALTFAADHGDVERARPEDWDPVRRLMLVHGTKTDTRTAWLPVLPHVEALFDLCLPALPVSWPRSSKALGEACRRAGLPHLSPKDLRRSAASWLVEEGADISFVSRFMRHSSDAMVRLVYGQVRPAMLGERLREASDRLLAASSITVTGEPVAAPPEHTLASQPAESTHETAWPLGGIGIRGGLKRPSGGSENIGNRDIPAGSIGSDRHAITRIGGSVGTPASQRTETDSGATEPQTRTVVTGCPDPGSVVRVDQRGQVEQLRAAGLLGARERLDAGQEPVRPHSPQAWSLAFAAHSAGVL
jgi:integrase